MKYILLLVVILASNICIAQYNKPSIYVDNRYSNITKVTFSPNWGIISVQRHSTGWIDTTIFHYPAAATVTRQMKNIQQHEGHCYTVTFKSESDYYTTTIWCSSENIEWSSKKGQKYE
jgi:hypothetical protein